MIIKFPETLLRTYYKTNYAGFTQLSDIHLHNPLKQYLTPYHLPDTFKLHEVDGDCELREYITETLAHIDEFKRGHTYYEFTNEIENILEGKEVLLQDKTKTEKWFRLECLLLEGLNCMVKE